MMCKIIVNQPGEPPGSHLVLYITCGPITTCSMTLPAEGSDLSTVRWQAATANKLRYPGDFVSNRARAPSVGVRQLFYEARKERIIGKVTHCRAVSVAAAKFPRPFCVLASDATINSGSNLRTNLLHRPPSVIVQRFPSWYLARPVLVETPSTHGPWLSPAPKALGMEPIGTLAR